MQLATQLREAILKLNPSVPTAAREDALKQVLDLGIPALLSASRVFEDGATFAIYLDLP